MTAQTARRPIYTTNRNGAPARWTTQPATTAQVGMIRSLAAKVALDDEIRTRLDQALIAGMTKGKASETIDWLGRRPVRQDAPVRAARPALPEVAAGRYAVEVEGTLGFYRVDRPTTGNWAGRTFVKVQASDELHPVRGAAVAAVLAKSRSTRRRPSSATAGRSAPAVTATERLPMRSRAPTASGRSAVSVSAGKARSNGADCP